MKNILESSLTLKIAILRSNCVSFSLFQLESRYINVSESSEYEKNSEKTPKVSMTLKITIPRSFFVNEKTRLFYVGVEMSVLQSQ